MMSASFSGLRDKGASKNGVKTVLGGLFALWLFSLLRLIPIIGDYKILDHLWLSCSTLVETSVWEQEGAFALGFEHISPGLSIEAQEIVANSDLTHVPLNAARSAYVSYPPGTLLPVWLFSNLLACEPSLALVRMVNALHCLGIVLMLALITTAALKNFESRARYGAAFLAGLFYLYAERTTLVHFSSYFTEISVMLPVAVVLWYETDDRPAPLRLPVALVVLYGGLCESTIYILAAVIGGELLIRYFLQSRNFSQALKQALRETAYLSLPLMTALLLFIIQLIHLNGFEALATKMAMRTGRGDEQGNPFPAGLYLSYYNSKFLFLTLVALLPCVWGWIKAYPGLKKRGAQAEGGQAEVSQIHHLKVVCLYAICCVIHLVVLWDYNLIHNFLTIKFYLLFSLIIGILLGRLFERLSLKLVLIYTMVLSLIWFSLQTRQLKEFTVAPDLPLTEYAQIIKEHNSFENVFLSAEFKIHDMPPHLLSISGKRVYQLPLREDLYKHFMTLEQAKFKFLITANLLSRKKHEEMEKKGFSPEHYPISGLPDLYIYTFTAPQLKNGVESLLAR